MKYIDLFGGIGGFRLGIQRVNDSEECVWYCDNNKYATKVYNRNFREEWKPTDVRTATDVPEHDLICAGFPCQSFSIAGRRKGFDDTRGTLFYEICRIAERYATPFLLLENVKGLLSHDRGRTFATILATLDEMGYRVQWEVLNSKHFGVPQNRERVFIVASLRDRPSPKIFPLGESQAWTSEVEREPEEGGEGLGNEVASSVTDQGKLWGRGGTSMITTGAVRAGDKWQDMVAIHNIYGGFGEGNPRISEGYAPTVRTPAGGGHIPCVGTITEAVGTRQGSSKEFLSSVDVIAREIGQVRRLTPIECERLQGFPDNWTLCPSISDTQRYKMLGNAVTVNVVQAIMERWANYK